jgi:dolichyl-phosphate beta-glucosyltransferase
MAIMSELLTAALAARTDEVNTPILSVVVPAYNESARLLRTLKATTAYLDGRCLPFELLVVDDGSRDQTTEVVETFVAEYAARENHKGVVRCLRYEQNRGKGHAVRFGVLRTTGDFVLFMDADLATPIEELTQLERAIDIEKGILFAIGSRPLRDSRLEVRQPWYRELCGRTFNKVVQILATPGISDTQCGFKLLSSTAAQNIFSRCQLDGFSFDVEALFLARKLGYRIAEVPVRWAHQEGAAAFSTRGAYLRQGILMLADLRRIRWIHRDVRPMSAKVKTSAPNS